MKVSSLHEFRRCTYVYPSISESVNATFQHYSCELMNFADEWAHMNSIARQMLHQMIACICTSRRLPGYSNKRDHILYRKCFSILIYNIIYVCVQVVAVCKVLQKGNWKYKYWG